MENNGERRANPKPRETVPILPSGHHARHGRRRIGLSLSPFGIEAASWHEINPRFDAAPAGPVTAGWVAAAHASVPDSFDVSHFISRVPGFCRERWTSRSLLGCRNSGCPEVHLPGFTRKTKLFPVS
jgi:hypothetical protein